MIINHNMMAMNTHRQMAGIGRSQSKSTEKLSSGMRINRAGDDAAGLAISEKMRAQVRGLNQASRNAQDGISLIQSAEGALNETQSILQRMRELAVQASNDTNVAVDRGEIQKEINQLTSEINRIGNTTEFNTMKLLNGDKAEAVKETKALAKTYKLADKGFTISTGAIKLGADGIKFDNELATGIKLEKAVKATVILSKNADGNLEVKLDAATEGDTSTLDIDEEIELSFEGGSYTYNNHGVSFEISQEDFENAEAGKELKFDLATNKGLGGATAFSATAVGNYTNDSPLTFSGISKMGELTIGSDVDFNVATIEFEVAKEGKQHTLTLKDSAGKTLVTEKVELGEGTSAINYNKHGISFEITDIPSTSASDFKIDLEMGLGDKAVNKGLSFQVGANEHQSMGLSISDMRANALGVSVDNADTEGYVKVASVTDGTNNAKTEYALDVSNHKSAASAATVINKAIESVSTQRSQLGAVQNRLEHTINNLDTSSENLQAAESRIRDVDMAKEMMTFTKNNILQQAAQSMLAQANQAPQGVLQLLR